MPLMPISLGSNSTVSRQATSAYFPQSDANNTVEGFISIQQGIALQDASTNCFFDALYPFSGALGLNGGTLTLKRDLFLQSPFVFGIGTIDGKGSSISFPGNVEQLSFPSSYPKLINLQDSIDIDDNVNSVHWSHDGKYLALAADTKNGISEIQVFEVVNNNLSLLDSYDVGNRDVDCIRWHPSSYYLAYGQNSGNELGILFFNDGTENLSLVDSKNIDDIYAVAWNPNGNYLAVGERNDDTFRIYAFIEGTLGTLYTYDFGDNRRIERNNIDWKDSEYLAVGLLSDDGDELFILKFNGSSITKNAGYNIGRSVYALSWIPGTSILSVGLSGGSSRLCFFEHDQVGGSLTHDADIESGDTATVFGISWTPDAQLCAIVRASSSSGHEVKVYAYDSSKKLLNFITGYKSGRTMRAIAWHPEKSYLATGDSSDFVCLYSFDESDLTFRNTKLFFESDVYLTTPLYFEGDCLISCRGFSLELAQTASLVIKEGAQLTLTDVNLKGINNNIVCKDNESSLILRDVKWIQDANTIFDKGSILFKNDVVMSGDDTTFAYQSIYTSTIAQKSSLMLDIGFTFSYDPIDYTLSYEYAPAEVQLIFDCSPVPGGTDFGCTLIETNADENIELTSVTLNPINSNYQQRLNFEDVSSKLIFDGGTFAVTFPGVKLQKGTLLVTRDSKMTSDKMFFATTEGDELALSNGITLGDGTNANDMKVDILGGILLDLAQGELIYRNVNNSSWKMANDNSILKISPSAQLSLYQNMTLGLGIIQFGERSVYGRLADKRITGNVSMLGRVGFATLT